MSNARRLFSIFDIFIILFFVIITVISVFLFLLPENGGKIVTVKVDNDTVMTLSLKNNTEQTIKTQYGTNTVTVKDGFCYVSDADCRDGICLKSGKICKSGESIVCLPHRLIVEVE